MAEKEFLCFRMVNSSFAVGVMGQLALTNSLTTVRQIAFAKAMAHFVMECWSMGKNRNLNKFQFFCLNI